ncbi:MAG: HigA family addiction module antidote protein [Proteobacteria bacterium]|nr:HigA family addiction module antidote protein [Pseudomonadota bacterium]MBI3499119.1 HigA family addiction module antidote protein [Pseudomonadota bacterium]
MSRSPITIDEGVRDGLPPTYPGEILREELSALGLSASAFAAAIDVPPNRVTQILAGRRSVTADSALRLARFFGTTARFWLNLQSLYDLKVAAAESGSRIIQRVRPRAA